MNRGFRGGMGLESLCLSDEEDSLEGNDSMCLNE